MHALGRPRVATVLANVYSRCRNTLDKCGLGSTAIVCSDGPTAWGTASPDTRVPQAAAPYRLTAAAEVAPEAKIVTGFWYVTPGTGRSMVAMLLTEGR